MEQSTTEKKSNTDIAWEAEKIGKWRDNISNATLEKLQAEHGNTNIMICTNESFSSELYACRGIAKSLERTIKGKREIIEEDAVKPLGIEFIFTKNSQDIATTFMNRDPLKQMYKEGTVASFFKYGQYLRAFPRDTLLINRLETVTHPKCMFKTNTLAKDRFETERIKQVITALKKDNGT